MIGSCPPQNAFMAAGLLYTYNELRPLYDARSLYDAPGELWCDLVKRFGKIVKRVAGKPESLAQEAIIRGRTGYRTGSSPLPSAS